MRYAAKNQTNTNLICKLLHSFIENSKIIFFLAGALFSVMAILLYKCWQYNLIYFYEKAFFLGECPFRTIRNVSRTGRKFRTRCHFTKKICIEILENQIVHCTAA